MTYTRNNRNRGDNRFLKLFILAGLLICSAIVHAQEAGPESQNQSKDPPSTRAQKVQAKKQKEQEKRVEKARKEAMKQHMKDQSPAVRKRMKADAHQADLNNSHKREFFLKRWFSKKKAS